MTAPRKCTPISKRVAASASSIARPSCWVTRGRKVGWLRKSGVASNVCVTDLTN